MTKKYEKPQMIIEELLMHDCITASGDYDNGLDLLAQGNPDEPKAEFSLLG